jgi:hypothetical protein
MYRSGHQTTILTFSLFCMVSVMGAYASDIEPPTAQLGITEQEAIAQASQFAKNDPNDRFQNPYVENATKLDNKWVVRILSQPPDPLALGGYYLYVTIDSSNGEILASDAGGGS